MVIALATAFKWPLHQMDVIYVYLNDKLEEEIYMEQLQRYIDPQHKTKVCRLLKSLYGLKLAGRQCNRTIDNYIFSKGYKWCLLDTTLYVKRENGKTILCVVYVDDLIITDNNELGITEYWNISNFQNQRLKMYALLPRYWNLARWKWDFPLSKEICFWSHHEF